MPLKIKIMGFIKSFFASCLGTIVGVIALLFIGGAILSVMVAADSSVSVASNSVLYLNLDAPIAEQAIEDPFAEFFPGESQPIGLLQLKEVINHAKTDSKIEGIYLNVSYIMAGISTIDEIRKSLIDFKSSGKWVIAYSDGYSEGAYYLASVADKIYLNPEGQLEFNGLSAEIAFFKKMFDKLEIRPQVFRVGEFKSAVEPFIREDLSEENKLQLNAMLGSIHGEMLSAISEARQIPKAKLKEISDEVLVRLAEDALELKLVDELLYDDQARGELRALLGLDEEEKIDFIRYAEYKKSSISLNTSSNEIAVIVADGDIMPGRADNGVVGSSTIVKEIRSARNNDDVKAIIVRINSPGGVAQAADEMWREIWLAKQEKPVIASMSDYAASGGYYLAMACDTIVAQPTTITGSIGVFSVIFDISQFLSNKIGVTSEEVKTGKVGGLSFTRPMNEMEKEIWQTQTDKIYDTFTKKAAEGRGMSQDDIKKMASGRVWTGVQAKDNGLVDVLGGYMDAVEIATQRSGVGSDYALKYYPQPKSLLDQITGGWQEDVKADATKEKLGTLYPWFVQWEKIKRYEGAQARLPFEFELR